MARKLRRMARTIARYADRPLLDERLARLHALGYLPRVPARLQLVVGSIDMLRFWISPAAAEYYASRGIHYGFHQILRFLDDPAGMVDPTGFLCERDIVIGHLMQVVHANPAYDLQLLDAHEDGIDDLERQLERILAGTHPRSRSIGAIVEEPDYHARLLEFTRKYKIDRDADAPLRDNIQTSPRWREIEQTFGTLPRAMAYFCELPATPLAAARHILFVREFPRAIAARALGRAATASPAAARSEPTPA